MGCCTKEGSSGPMQCVWKEGECALNPLYSMWLLDAWAIFENLVRVAQGFVCKVCRGGGRLVADEFCFEDVELECVGEFAYLGNMLNDTGGKNKL